VKLQPRVIDVATPAEAVGTILVLHGKFSGLAAEFAVDTLTGSGEDIV